MAGETVEQGNNWIDSIKNDLTGLWDKIKNGWHDLMKKIGLEKEEATKETVSDTQKKLDDLSTKLINIELSKLEDKEIDENIEGNLDDESTVLGMLAKNNENIKNWFNWILEKDSYGNYIIDDEDFRSREIEKILYLLHEISNSEKSDLTEQELKDIGEQSKKKMEVCNNVLNSNKIKELPEDKRTKKSIIEAYNELYEKYKEEDKKQNPQITEQNIIDKLKLES